MSEEKRAKVFPLGPKYLERRDIDRSFKNGIASKESEGLYQMLEGEYILPFNDTQSYLFSEELFNKELIGTEVVLDRIIDGFTKSKLDSNDPLVFVDFGGMLGSTWCRLAYKYRKYIESGEMKFIVTNLNFSREKIEEAVNMENKRDPVAQEIIDAFNLGKGLVEYQNADSKTLWEKYKGKINILHEKHTLMHSLQPDMDLLLLSQCIHTNGLMLYDSSYSHPSDRNENLRKDVDLSFDYGFGNATRNLTYVDGVSDYYNVFAGRYFDTSIFNKAFPDSTKLSS